MRKNDQLFDNETIVVNAISVYNCKEDERIED